MSVNTVDVKCETCGHVTAVLENAEGFLCGGCRRWLPAPNAGSSDSEQSAMERARAWKAIKGDSKP